MVGFAVHAYMQCSCLGEKIDNYLKMNVCRMNLQCISHYNF